MRSGRASLDQFRDGQRADGATWFPRLKIGFQDEIVTHNGRAVIRVTCGNNFEGVYELSL
jgi:hypothetical protein